MMEQDPKATLRDEEMETVGGGVRARHARDADGTDQSDDADSQDADGTDQSDDADSQDSDSDARDS